MLLVDRRRPASFDACLAALRAVAPAAAAKARFLECDVASPDLAAAIDAALADAARTDVARAEAAPRDALFSTRRDMLGDPPPQAAGRTGDCGGGGGDGGGGSRDGVSFGGGDAGNDGGVSVLGLHACGALTDAVLRLASARGALCAVMPCCYTGTAAGAPPGVRRALGVAAAADVDRSYRLQAQGYSVDWAAIPKRITPMNRILIAVPVSGWEPPHLRGGGKA